MKSSGPPMFLKRLILENIRSIEKLDLSFENSEGKSRKWTILLGENGAGKSTVLRSIALGLAGSNALPELLVNSDEWIRKGQDFARIAIDIATADDEPRHIALELRRGEALSKTFSSNSESLELLDAALSHSARNYFTIGYGVSRRMHTTRSSSFTAPETMRNPRSQSVATLFSPDASLRSVESWAMDLDYRKPAEAKTILQQTFAEMLPGINFERIDKEQRKLLFATPDGELPLDVLSDGYQNIISWCGDLLYRITEVFADYQKPLEARGLLLIDEVDLHLHPIWQRRLIEFLQKKLPNFQIFATTHSPMTAHQACEGELYLLKRLQEAGPPVLEMFPGEPRNLLLHQFLMSPAFGLYTADSRHIEELKKEYDELQKAPDKTPQDEGRESELAEKLADAPEWQLNTPQANERVKLLAEIRRELGSSRN